MDQRELDARLKALQKAVAEKEAPSTIISILETLKKEVVPTEELLRVRSLFMSRIPEGVHIATCRMRRHCVLFAWHSQIATVANMSLDHQSWCSCIQTESQSEQGYCKARC
jgi:hypothetical protein